MNPEKIFCKWLKARGSCRVLELGTLQWEPGVPTHHSAWLPEGSEHIKSDIEAGPDVDVVSDAHDLREFENESFDAVIAVSVWEHLRYPWVAANAAARVLRPGGLLYVATHHAFPVHGYPSDYTRWTDEGLKALFDEPLWTDRVADYRYPAVITPPPEVTRWNTAAPAYLNVDIAAKKSYL